MQACRRCGATIPEAGPMKALGGLCPACVLRRQLQEPRDGQRERARRNPAPTLDELAPHFPDLEFQALIGQGGMGAVYRVVQKGLGRVAALKVLALDAESEPEFGVRFEREARLLAGLHHENIVGVHAAGKSGPHWYLLMELVEGPSLRQLIEDGEVEPRLALSIVSQVCEALQHAHERGVVHRDVKPENILVGRDGVAKILDFGLAKMVGHEPRVHTLTLTGQVMGTLRYMAPEQYERPLEVDHRADIYSLGIVLYELLTGEVPMGAFAPASQKANIDAKVDEIVRRSLEREPARRYQHASDVRIDMAKVTLGVVPTAAAPALGPQATTNPSTPPHPQRSTGARLEPIRLLGHLLWLGALALVLFLTMLESGAHQTLGTRLIVMPAAMVALVGGLFILRLHGTPAERPGLHLGATWSMGLACLATAMATTIALFATRATVLLPIAVACALVLLAGAWVMARRIAAAVDERAARVALFRGAALGTVAVGMAMLADAVAELHRDSSLLVQLLPQVAAGLTLVAAGCGTWLVAHWPRAGAKAEPRPAMAGGRALAWVFAGGLAALGAAVLGGTAAAASIRTLTPASASLILVVAACATWFGGVGARAAVRGTSGEARFSSGRLGAGATLLVLFGAVATLAGEGVGSWRQLRARRDYALEEASYAISRPARADVGAWDVDPNDTSPRMEIYPTNQGSVDMELFLQRSPVLPEVGRGAFAPDAAGEAEREFLRALGGFVWINHYAQLLTHAEVEWRDAGSANIRVPRLDSSPRLRDTAERMLDLHALGALELDALDIDEDDYRQTLRGLGADGDDLGVYASFDLATRIYAWSVNQHRLGAAVADRTNGGLATPRRRHATLDDALDAMDLRERMELGSIEARVELHQLDGRPRGRILWADGRVTEIDEDAMERRWSHLPGLLGPKRR